MTTVKGYLNVGQAVTLASTLNVGSELSVGKAVNFEDTLDVTGDTSVFTFDSSGTTSLAVTNGDVNIASAGAITTVKGNLNVDESVTLASTLNVGSELNVGGAVTLASTLNVGSTLSIGDTVTIKRASNYNDKKWTETGDGTGNRPYPTMHIIDSIDGSPHNDKHTNLCIESRYEDDFNDTTNNGMAGLSFILNNNVDLNGNRIGTGSGYINEGQINYIAGPGGGQRWRRTR